MARIKESEVINEVWAELDRRNSVIPKQEHERTIKELAQHWGCIEDAASKKALAELKVGRMTRRKLGSSHQWLYLPAKKK